MQFVSDVVKTSARVQKTVHPAVHVRDTQDTDSCPVMQKYGEPQNRGNSCLPSALFGKRHC